MLRKDFQEVAAKWCPAGKGNGLDVIHPRHAQAVRPTFKGGGGLPAVGISSPGAEWNVGRPRYG
jgi:hypothetical protein